MIYQDEILQVRTATERQRDRFVFIYFVLFLKLPRPDLGWEREKPSLDRDLEMKLVCENYIDLFSNFNNKCSCRSHHHIIAFGGHLYASQTYIVLVSLSSAESKGLQVEKSLDVSFATRLENFVKLFCVLSNEEKLRISGLPFLSHSNLEFLD